MVDQGCCGLVAQPVQRHRLEPVGIPEPAEAPRRAVRSPGDQAIRRVAENVGVPGERHAACIGPGFLTGVMLLEQGERAGIKGDATGLAGLGQVLDLRLRRCPHDPAADVQLGNSPINVGPAEPDELPRAGAGDSGQPKIRPEFRREVLLRLQHPAHRRRLRGRHDRLGNHRRPGEGRHVRLHPTPANRLRECNPDDVVRLPDGRGGRPFSRRVTYQRSRSCTRSRLTGTEPRWDSTWSLM
jgi:hypothetical protein